MVLQHKQHSLGGRRSWGGCLLTGLIAYGCLTGGTAQAQELNYPLAVAAADDGTLYIADRYLPGVWKVTNGKTEVYFQGSKKFRTPLNAVRCLAIDKQGRLLAGDSATRDVYRFDESAKPKPLTGGKIGIPMDIAVAGDGNFVKIQHDAKNLDLPQAQTISG